MLIAIGNKSNPMITGDIPTDSPTGTAMVGSAPNRLEKRGYQIGGQRLKTRGT